VFGLFGSNSNRYIGLDIGSSRIKAVGLQNNNSPRPKLIGISSVATPPGVISDGAIIESKSLLPAILDAFAQAKLKVRGQNVVLGLKGLNILYKKVVIPFQEGPAMAEQVLREAQVQIDSELGDWVIDYQILTEKDDQGQVAVMIVAGKRSMIEEVHRIMLELGARPVIFDCDIFAISNVHELSYKESKERSLFIDVGKDSTKVLFKNAEGVPILVRSLSIGGGHLTDSMSRNLSIDMHRAESLKISSSQSGTMFQDQQLGALVKKHIDELLAELSQTIDFYAGSAENPADSTIETIFLTGGAATTTGLAHAISQKLRARVEFLDPFRNIEISGRAQVPEDIQPHVFATGLGLALRYFGDKPE
jgi:type IV pilus assembly protein PilM